jgi:hypothetical protein
MGCLGSSLSLTMTILIGLYGEPTSTTLGIGVIALMGLLANAYNLVMNSPTTK